MLESHAMPGAPCPTPFRARDSLAVVATVIHSITQILPGRCTMLSLCGYELADGSWSSLLRGYELANGSFCSLWGFLQSQRLLHLSPGSHLPECSN